MATGYYAIEYPGRTSLEFHGGPPIFVVDTRDWPWERSSPVITECPCCGFDNYLETPKNEDDAVLSCDWCTKNVKGEPHFCARAEEINRERTRINPRNS
jgi:hypothetical protein